MIVKQTVQNIQRNFNLHVFFLCRDFHISDNSVTKVDMMKHKGDYGYSENSDLDCKVLELP